MTAALKAVRILAETVTELGAEHGALANRYYRRIGKVVDMVWFVVREQNLRFPWMRDVEKKRPFYFRALTWYMDRVMELVHDDIEAYRVLLAVIHVVKAPTALLTPPMAWKVLSKWAFTKLRGEKTLIERNFGDGSVKPHFASGPLIGMGGGPIAPPPPNEALQSHDRGSFAPGPGR
jgi:hypothetical protein